MSAIPFIDRVEHADDESDHGLFVRLAFADGLTETVLAERSEDFNRLADKKRAIEAAPRGGLFGLPQHPDLCWDVPATYARAKAKLSQGMEYRPPLGVGPAMQFAAAKDVPGSGDSPKRKRKAWYDWLWRLLRRMWPTAP